MALISCALQIPRSMHLLMLRFFVSLNLTVITMRHTTLAFTCEELDHGQVLEIECVLGI